MAAMEEASPLSRIEHPIRSYRLADPRFPRLRRLLLEGVPTAHQPLLCRLTLLLKTLAQVRVALVGWLGTPPCLCVCARIDG